MPRSPNQPVTPARCFGRHQAEGEREQIRVQGRHGRCPRRRDKRRARASKKLFLEAARGLRSRAV